MVNPVKVTISSGNKKLVEDGENGTIELQANSRITQTVEVVDPRGKEQRLLQILKQYQRGKAQNDRILVFCLYKKETVRVEQFLQQRGVKVASIHGDLRQEQRTRSLEAFKAGTTSVLLATDVAARGLDIPEVKLVVNLTVSTTLSWTLTRSSPELQLTFLSSVPIDYRRLCSPYRSYRTCWKDWRGYHAFHRA